jgi:FkbM family methyltransferase
MSRFREYFVRTVNAGLIAALGWLHRAFDVQTTYRIGPDGIAALFEGSWFTYSLRQFGSTGNIDYVPDAENATRRALFDRVRDGDVIYDIGAHGGVYTITLMRRFPATRIISFEPQPEDLIANLRLNELPIDGVQAVAVGAEAGTVRMTTGERSSNHVNEKGDRDVPIVRIDDYAAVIGLPMPNWIKIDIEGLELPALQGAERLIRRARPTIICEINHLHDRFGTTVPAFVGWMRSLGYEIHKLAEGKLQPIEGDVDFPALGYSADWNFWFVPQAWGSLDVLHR